MNDITIYLIITGCVVFVLGILLGLGLGMRLREKLESKERW